jgi:hypothetical protein
LSLNLSPSTSSNQYFYEHWSSSYLCWCVLKKNSERLLPTSP